MPTIGMRRTSWKMRQLMKRKPETAILSEVVSGEVGLV